MGALKTIRIVLWTLVVVAAIGAAWIWYTNRPGEIAVASAPYGAGDYEMVTHEGEAVDDTIFVGQPSMVFFGFTHCPDVCPTTLADMQHWFAELGPEADELRAFFVSVDPERDTPQVLGEYVSWASDRVTGLTGEPGEIAKVVDAWGVSAERVPLEGGGYTVSHTASVFLLDENGEFFGTIAYGENPETALGKLRRLVSG